MRRTSERIDDIMAAGFHRMRATWEGRLTTTQGRREREPGEEG
jgi:hypothetical protein